MHNDGPLFLLLKGTCKSLLDKVSAYSPEEIGDKIESDEFFGISKEESIVIFLRNAADSIVEWTYMDNAKTKRIDGTSIVEKGFTQWDGDWYCVYLDLDIIMKYSDGIYSKNSKRIYVSFSIKDHKGKEQRRFSVWFKKTAGIEKTKNAASVKAEMIDDEPVKTSATTQKNKLKRDNPFHEETKNKKTKIARDPQNNAQDTTSSSSSNSTAFSSFSASSLPACSCNNTDIPYHGESLQYGQLNCEPLRSWSLFAQCLVDDLATGLRSRLGEVYAYTGTFCDKTSDPSFIATAYTSKLIGVVNDANQELIRKIIEHLVQNQPIPPIK